MKMIDSDNYKASGIETLFFPGGEPHVRIPENFGEALLFLKARTWNDVGLALVLLDALHWQDNKIWLFCPYLPGARQDRTDGQTPITASLTLDFLYHNAHLIFTFDTHSDVTAKYSSYNFMPSDLDLPVEYFGNPNIIVPDAGALDRCKNFDNMFGGFNKPLIRCEKKRDFATGKFTGFFMPPLPGPGRYLIVDDICDGGGTFNLLAEKFLEDPYGSESTLELWVSHGIFSKSVDNIHSKITKIYTTDSWCRISYQTEYGAANRDPRVQVISLQPIIDKILKGAT